MDIGTAKPDRRTLAQAPHRLIDILDPSRAYSAARFREDALREMAAVRAAGRIPLLVGGTMLYFHALEHGLTQLPGADSKVRARLEEEARSIGWAALHKRLLKIDPEAAKRIHPRDPQRLQRALEVYELTGLPLSEHYRRGTAQTLPYSLIKIVLMPARRELLHNRIAKRFLKMLEQGLIIEVEALYKRGDLKADMPSMRAVGYRQVWDYMQGHLDYEAMTYKAIAATRQLAKRQQTWLRSVQHAQRFDPDQCSPASIVTKICAYLG
jgi:tRNA dimethylallyltransferase